MVNTWTVAALRVGRFYSAHASTLRSTAAGASKHELGVASHVTSSHGQRQCCFSAYFSHPAQGSDPGTQSIHFRLGEGGLLTSVNNELNQENPTGQPDLDRLSLGLFSDDSKSCDGGSSLDLCLTFSESSFLLTF